MTQDVNPDVALVAGSRPPNIVLIVLDCARAKNFSFSGGGRIAPTPVIDSIAANGTAFPRAVAPSTWTLPSHASLFTGSYPNQHGIRSYVKPIHHLTTTAEFLRNAGYDTCMITENPQLTGDFGLESGFDIVRCNSREKALATIFGVKRGGSSFVYSPGFIRLLSRIPPAIAPLTWTTRLQEVAFKREVCTPVTIDQFDDWLAGLQDGRPFYGFLNLLDTHEPYNLVSLNGGLSLLDRTYLYAPRSHLLMVPGLQSRVRWDSMVGGYVNSIADADKKVGRLMSILRARQLLSRTMVIVTSDHGQAFGELGNVHHGAGATDSVTRVPLAVLPPQGVSVPHRVDCWVSLTAVDSWIRAAAAGLPPYDSKGRAPAARSSSMAESGIVYCEGPPVSDVNRAMRGLGRDQFWGHRLLVAYRDDEKLVLDQDTNQIVPMGHGS